MSEVVKGLLAQVAALSDTEREQFFDGLDEMYESDDSEELTQEEWEEAWAAEVNRRMEDVKAGRAKTIPAEEVMARLREKYG